MQTIKAESKLNANLATNIDKLRSRHLEQDIDIAVTFPAFSVFSYDQNMFLLLSNSIKVKFDPKWAQRPDYVSIEHYGTAIHWQLILYVNQINRIEEFIELNNILIPSYASIVKTSKLRKDVNYTDEVGVEELSNVVNYYKIHPLDASELERRKSNNALNRPSGWVPGDVNEWYPNIDPNKDGIDDSWDAGIYPVEEVDETVPGGDEDPNWDNPGPSEEDPNALLTPPPDVQSIELLTFSDSLTIEINELSALFTTVTVDSTGFISALTVIDINSNGSEYSTSGDTANLKTSELEFNDTNYVIVRLNGVVLVKGTQVIWDSQDELHLFVPIVGGDELTIDS